MNIAYVFDRLICSHNITPVYVNLFHASTKGHYFTIQNKLTVCLFMKSTIGKKYGVNGVIK